MKSSPRSGFLILALIAFTSILLVLSTAFYFYCKNGANDSGLAYTYARSRIALHAAMAYSIYVVRYASQTSALSVAIKTYDTTARSPRIIPLGDISDPRTLNSAYIRIAPIDSSQQPVILNTFTPLPAPATTVKFAATIGVGSSHGEGGGPSGPIFPTGFAMQEFEYRRWYVLGVDPVTPAITTVTYSATPPTDISATLPPANW